MSTSTSDPAFGQISHFRCCLLRLNTAFAFRSCTSANCDSNAYTGERLKVAIRAAHTHIVDMKPERLSETISERNQRREAELTEALEREATRHDAAVKNMHRLRALRLERDQNKSSLNGDALSIISKNKSAPNGPSPINEPPPPIDDPPKPPQPDEPPKPPPVNDPPGEKPPPMRSGVNQRAAANES